MSNHHGRICQPGKQLPGASTGVLRSTIAKRPTFATSYHICSNGTGLVERLRNVRNIRSDWGIPSLSSILAVYGRAL
ncbi:hypothetical protein IG631_12812 [Alternaria alternata]|nr:hypothetical protein IG631_12812 [Alternaria alternata]